MSIHHSAPHDPASFVYHTHRRPLETNVQSCKHSHRCSPSFARGITSGKDRLPAGEQQPHVWDVLTLVCKIHRHVGDRLARRSGRGLRGDAISNSGRKHCSSDGALNAGTPSPSPAALNAAALDYAGHDKGVHRLVTASNHSITSSARARSVGGISRPSTLAVLRLMTSSYLVGA